MLVITKEVDTEGGDVHSEGHDVVHTKPPSLKTEKMGHKPDCFLIMTTTTSLITFHGLYILSHNEVHTKSRMRK